jgi:NagD protein
VTRAVALDLDGTVYLSGRPLPGAVDAVGTLRDNGIGVVFVSNNPTVDATRYAHRLTALGIPTGPEHVLTSGGVTAAWLREHHPDAKLLLVSEPSLRAELAAAGCRLAESPEDADVVVVSFDRTFDYAKWTAAFSALRHGALFVATNPDATCPVEGGEIPDCAGIIAALEATTGRSVDVVVGKPSPTMAAAVLDRLRGQVGAELGASDVLVVGDRLVTDVGLGRAGGFATALVLTGVTAAADVPDDDGPDHVLAGLHELPGVVLGDATEELERSAS